MVSFTHQDKKVLPSIRELTNSKLYPLSNAMKAQGDVVEWVDKDADTGEEILNKTSFSPKEVYTELPVSDKYVKQDGVHYAEALKPWLNSIYRALNTEMLSATDGAHMQGIFNAEHAGHEVLTEGDYMTLKEGWNLGSELSKLTPMPKMYASINQWKAWASEPVTNENKAIKYEFSLGSLGGCPLVRTTSQVGAVVAYPDNNYQIKEKEVQVSHFEKADAVQHFFRAVSYVDGKFINPNNVWIAQKAPEFIIEDGTEVDDTMFEAYQGFAGIVNWVAENCEFAEGDWGPVYRSTEMPTEELRELISDDHNTVLFFIDNLNEDEETYEIAIRHREDIYIGHFFEYEFIDVQNDWESVLIEDVPNTWYPVFVIHTDSSGFEAYGWNDETGTIGEPIPLG